MRAEKIIRKTVVLNILWRQKGRFLFLSQSFPFYGFDLKYKRFLIFLRERRESRKQLIGLIHFFNYRNINSNRLFIKTNQPYA